MLREIQWIVLTWYGRWGIGVRLVIQMYHTIPKRRSAKALEHLHKLNNQDLSNVYRNLFPHQDTRTSLHVLFICIEVIVLLPLRI